MLSSWCNSKPIPKFAIYCGKWVLEAMKIWVVNCGFKNQFGGLPPVPPVLLSRWPRCRVFHWSLIQVVMTTFECWDLVKKTLLDGQISWATVSITCGHCFIYASYPPCPMKNPCIHPWPEKKRKQTSPRVHYAMAKMIFFSRLEADSGEAKYQSLPSGTNT